MLTKTKHVVCLRCLSTVRRKYPINPDESKTLPVFDYGVSKESYRRVFVWGNLLTGALGVPYMKKDDNTIRREILNCPKRLGFAEKFPVLTAACGFGFSVFSTDSDVKLYGCGLNTDSQIGSHVIRKGHPLEIVFFPQPIPLPWKHPEKAKIKKLAAGRAHSVVLTNEGLFLLGNNSYGQCARPIIEDEDYFLSSYINHVPDIDGKRVTDIECGQDHTLAVTEDGALYSCGWGADGQTGLGTFHNTSTFTKVKGDVENESIVKVSSRSDFVLALNTKGQVFGWGNAEYAQILTGNNDQQVSNPTYMKNLEQLGRITEVGAGGASCVAVNAEGEVFTWGYGILGVGPTVEQSYKPIKIPDTLFGKNDFQPSTKVVKVACGLSYAMAVTNFGDIYAWGRNMRGCLGLRHENDQYFPFKISLGGYTKHLFCGLDHAIAICEPFI